MKQRNKKHGVYLIMICPMFLFCNASGSLKIRKYRENNVFFTVYIHSAVRELWHFPQNLHRFYF